MAAPDLPPPVLILASREAGGSLLAALLGAHPGFAEAPHLNVLAFEEAWQMPRYCAIPRDSGLHGLLRFLGWHLLGEQSVQSVQAAQRWLQRRLGAPMAELHLDLRRLVAPRALVDYSPLVAQNGAAMARAAAAAAEARIVHLTRDPLAQGAAMCLPVWQTMMTSLDFWDRRGRLQPVMDAYEVGEQLIDWSAAPPVFDPQFAWHRTQRAARRLLADMPPGRARHLRREDLSDRPEEVLRDLLDWLGVESSAEVVRAMVEAPASPFASPGPYHAPFGMDFEMIGRAPGEVLREGGPSLARHPREAALPWRGDGEPLLDAVVALGQELGYAPA